MVEKSNRDNITGAVIENTATRWRGLASSLKPAIQKTNGAAMEAVDKPKEATPYEDNDQQQTTDVDITLIQRRTYFLSAWIGDTNKTFNKYKGRIGLVIWLINIAIHFSLDFYEANFVFNISWATCIGLFFVALVVGCFCMIKYSVPWFIKGVKKLKKDGHYPVTLQRLQLVMRLLPFAVPLFACGAAMGQFGCYWADGALKLSFGCKGIVGNNTTCEPTVPQEVETMFNVFRATSLVHIFYGFALLLMFHMAVIFMIQSSMTEFNKRMARMFRENPSDIAFPEAVDLFSARSRFVREGSNSCMIVLTTLHVACSISFVLNAYNFLFQNRFAIYIWFALAPLIWAVVPLLGAAWVTKTYHQRSSNITIVSHATRYRILGLENYGKGHTNPYKLVVVNAWVDIPEEHEIEAEAHEEIHKAHANKNGRSPSPARRVWKSMISRKKLKKDSSASAEIKGGTESDDNDSEWVKTRTFSPNLAKHKRGTVIGRKSQNKNGEVSLISIKARKSFCENDKPSETNPKENCIKTNEVTKPSGDRQSATTNSKLRKESEISLHFCSHSSKSRSKTDNAGIVQVHKQGSNPQIMLTDYDEKRKPNTGITTVHETSSNSSLVDIEGDEKAVEQHSSHSSRSPSLNEERQSSESEKNVIFNVQYVENSETRSESADTAGSSINLSKRPLEKSLSLPINAISSTQALDDDPRPKTAGETTRSSLKVPSSTNGIVDSQQKPNLMVGMAKTFHKWRTKTKKKRKFNFEKYIIYLESILPTVGFSVGGVVITWDGVSFFTVLLVTLVGIFAQEAFFGS